LKIKVVKTRKYSLYGVRVVGPKLKKSILNILRTSSRDIPFVFVIRLMTVLIIGSKTVIKTLKKPVDTVPIVESWT
jgi:hypothetical protein